MTFIRNRSPRNIKAGKLFVRIALILWIAVCIWLTLKLIYEQRYYSATGWTIISILFIFFFILSVIKPKESTSKKSMNINIHNVNLPDEAMHFVLLYSSKDIVRVAQIEEALKARDIKCIVLDRHGSLMMPFIPGVEMRIMVPREDYEWSVEIINGL